VDEKLGCNFGSSIFGIDTDSGTTTTKNISGDRPPGLIEAGTKSTCVLKYVAIFRVGQTIFGGFK